LDRLYQNPPNSAEELKVVYATGESLLELGNNPQTQFLLSMFDRMADPALLQSYWARDLVEAFIEHAPQLSPLWSRILEKHPQLRNQQPELGLIYDPWEAASLWNTDPSAPGLGVVRARSLRRFLERTAQFPLSEVNDLENPGLKSVDYTQNPSSAFQIRAELARPLLLTKTERTHFLNELTQKELAMIRDLLTVDCRLEPPSAIIEFYFFNHPVPSPGIIGRLHRASLAACRVHSRH
jgi:hypothetical protein